ncbi:FAD-binding PCMH-type domain-containing protein [Bordetella sputigena]|uniref:hypothetical protein n=1 Tax=Bordetella sputigena TaxID=1416810 RepID=UPI0039F01E9E
MQPSRRAFLMGRATPRTPWQVFCQSLRRVCAGELKLIHSAVGAEATIPGAGGPDRATTATTAAAADAAFPTAAGFHTAGSAQAAPQARWTPVDGANVRQARMLCAEHGVQLALAGSAVSIEGRPVLWVDPAALNGLARESGPVPRWRAGPGVTLGELAAAGLPQFAGADPAITLAAWFADRGAAAWPTGRGDLSGVHEADVLLADGVADTLGPFGADDGRPLRSATLQQLVPVLFRLASGEDARWCGEQPAWPARYRLDALLPAAPATLNLARMLHGHGGTLVWLESLVLEAPPGASPPPPPDVAGPAAPLPPARARALDRRVKDSFDPAGLFPEAP